MITGFEKETHELKAEELNILLPMLIAGFRTKTKDDPIKAPVIIEKMNEALSSKGHKFKLSEPRLRKLCNYIRSNGILPLIANSNGYFVSNDKKEIEDQITSMEERASAISNAANGLRKFLK